MITCPVKCDDITYQFLNFNGCTIEIWEYISNFIQLFITDVIRAGMELWGDTVSVYDVETCLCMNYELMNKYIYVYTYISYICFFFFIKLKDE